MEAQLAERISAPMLQATHSIWQFVVLKRAPTGSWGSTLVEAGAIPKSHVSWCQKLIPRTREAAAKMIQLIQQAFTLYGIVKSVVLWFPAQTKACPAIAYTASLTQTSPSGRPNCKEGRSKTRSVGQGPVFCTTRMSFKREARVPDASGLLCLYKASNWFSRWVRLNLGRQVSC